MKLIILFVSCRFKNFQFDRVTAKRKADAERYLREAYARDWSPQAAADPGASPKAVKQQKKKGQGTSLVGSMLGMGVDDEEDSSSEEEFAGNVMTNLQNSAERTEVERYLQLPQVNHITEQGSDVDIVRWWRDRSSEFPHLSKMARQFLALPCSSAGIVIMHECMP